MSIIRSKPEEVLESTTDLNAQVCDGADHADRLAMIMEAEAIQSALAGHVGEGELEGSAYPLDDVRELIAQEDADDASNDALHAGGMDLDPWQTAEQSAMHLVTESEMAMDHAWLGEQDFDSPGHRDLHDSAEGISTSSMTAEDATLMGIYPYL